MTALLNDHQMQLEQEKLYAQSVRGAMERIAALFGLDDDQDSLHLLGAAPNNNDGTHPFEFNKKKRRTQSINTGNLTYFDDIRNSTNTTLVTVEMRPGSAVQRISNGSSSFRLAHLLSMIATVDVPNLLAVQHFNDRSNVVVPDLEERLQDCDLYMTVDLVNGVGRPKIGVSKLLERLPSNPTLLNPRPIGIVGAGNSRTSKALAIVGGVNNLVQCSPSATSPDLDDRYNHPYFTRPIPTNLGSARAAVEYYKFLGATHVASLHVGDVYGREFAKVFVEQAEKAGIDVVSVSFDLGASSNHAKEAIQQLKDSDRHYIFGMFYESYLTKISDVAAPAGIMGKDYFWMIGEGSDNMNVKPADGNVESRIPYVNGMGRVALYIPESERFNAVLDSFRQDEELQQYYISKTVRLTT